MFYAKIKLCYICKYRLLGPAGQGFPLSASQVLASSFRDTRVVVMDNGVGILTNQEEEQIYFVVCRLLIVKFTKFIIGVF